MLRTAFFGLFIAVAATAPGYAAFVYQEDFDSPGQIGKGATGSSSDTLGVNWTIDVSGAKLTANTDWFRVEPDPSGGGRFDARDLDGPARWFTPVIDTSGRQTVAFRLDLSGEGGSNGLEDSDYASVFYSIDGSETRVENWNGLGNGARTLSGDFGATTIDVSNLAAGSTFQLIVEMRNNADDERLRLDNVSIQAFSAVPEPSSLALVSLAGLGLAYRRSRRS